MARDLDVTFSEHSKECMTMTISYRTFDARRFAERFFAGMPLSEVIAAVNHMQRRAYDENALHRAIVSLVRRGLFIQGFYGLYQAVYFEHCNPYDIRLDSL
jgi:hypothetical protein